MSWSLNLMAEDCMHSFFILQDLDLNFFNVVVFTFISHVP